MPLPLIPLIYAGSSLLGNAAGAFSTARQNRLNREFSMEMYNRQRADALSDWAMQNEYNSPAQQMARLKGAGLNPNLVYGNGATATASSGVRSSNPPGYRGEANRYDLSGVAQGLAMQYTIEQQKAQTDNIRAQTDVAKQELLLKAAQIGQTVAQTKNLGAQTDLTGVNTKTGIFKLLQDEQLSSSVLAAAKAGVDKVTAETGKIEADTKFTLDQNQRAAAMQAPNLKLAVVRILSEQLSQTKSSIEQEHIRQQLQSVQKSNQLLDLDIEIRKKLGLTTHDPAYLRIITNLLGSPQEFHDSINTRAKKMLQSIRNQLNFPEP